MHLAYQARIAVPRCLNYYELDKPSQPAYLMMEKIDGIPLANAEALNKSVLNVKELIRDFAGVLARLHTVTLSSLETDIKVSLPPSIYLNKTIIQEIDSAIERMSIRDQIYSQVIELRKNMLRESSLVLARWNSTLTHGDLTTGNLLCNWKTPNLAGILDWEWSGFSDPVKDLANLSLGLRCQGGLHLIRSLSEWRNFLSIYPIGKLGPHLESRFHFYLSYYVISLCVFFSKINMRGEMVDCVNWLNILTNDRQWNDFYHDIEL